MIPRLSEDRLALVRRLYETSELTVAEIAVLADVSESAIYQRVRREEWVSGRRPGVTPRRAKLRPPVPPTPALLALAGEPSPGSPPAGSARPASAPHLQAPHLHGPNPAADRAPGAAPVPPDPFEDVGRAAAAPIGDIDRAATAPFEDVDRAGTAPFEDVDRAGTAPFEDVDRAGTARRLWRAVNSHLADLEAFGGPDGMIRAAQNLSTLARTLETLVDVERSLAAPAQSAPGLPATALSAPGLPARSFGAGPAGRRLSDDEFRDEISRRLEAMLANQEREEADHAWALAPAAAAASRDSGEA